jgi:hypothetical protein
MELKIDLLKGKKKAPFRIVFGIVFVLLGIVVLFSKIKANGTANLFDWIYSGLFAFLGITHIVEGFGAYSFDRLFGNAYVLINSESISLKASVWSKKQFVNWSDVKTVDYRLNKFEIEKTDGSKMVIDLFEFNYRLVIEVKQTINHIAKEKNIQIKSQK